MPKLNKGRPEAGERQWFSVQAKKGDKAEIFIYDEIGIGYYGGGVAAVDLIAQVKALNLTAADELVVRVNSPGGSFFEGNAIYNYLRSLKAKIVVRVEGMAASSASLIAMAGDRIEMPENAMMFIHNPWKMVAGDANVMRKMAEDLDKMRDSAVATYLRRAGDKMNKDDLIEMLDTETWLGAEDAVKFGLADVVDEPVRAAAMFDCSKYGFPMPKALVINQAEIRKAQRAQLQALKV
jgi:ATP-dependent Clp protease protease subunit